MGNFFFCYDKSMMLYLRSSGHKYITKAINPNTKNMFALFEVSSELNESIKIYNKEARRFFG